MIEYVLRLGAQSPPASPGASGAPEDDPIGVKTIGRLIGEHYRIESMLGHGGTSIVFAARDERSW